MTDESTAPQGQRELASCPFCGGEAIHEKHSDLYGCLPCDAWMDDAESWNRRAPTQEGGEAKQEWMTLLETFLASVGASRPSDHEWVRTARDLLDRRPWRQGVVAGVLADLAGQGQVRDPTGSATTPTPPSAEVAWDDSVDQMVVARLLHEIDCTRHGFVTPTQITIYWQNAEKGLYRGWAARIIAALRTKGGTE